jgi:hypothetical protein
VTTEVIIATVNQSNGAGKASGTVVPGIPDASIPYYARELDNGDGGSGHTEFGPLQLKTFTATANSHGSEFTLCKTLQAAGRDVIMASFWRGATFINQWLAGGPINNDLLARVAYVCQQLPILRPGGDYRFWLRTNQGEEEARSILATVQLWRGRHTGIYNQVCNVIRGYYPHAPITQIISCTRIHITGATNPGEPAGATVFNAEQIQAAADVGGIAVSQEGLSVITDGVHLDEAGLNDLGVREANAVLEKIDMATLSDTYRGLIIGFSLGLNALTPTANVKFRAFYTNGSEVSGTGYGVLTVVNDTTKWNAADASRKKTNKTSFDFATAGGSWGTPAQIRMYDNADVEMGRYDIPSPSSIGTGETLSIPAGAFELTLTGVHADAEAKALLDHVLGATVYTPETTLKFAYYAADPKTGGSKITGTGYADVSVTNDSTSWNAITGGASSNKLGLNLGTAGGTWTTATHWGLLDAAGTTLKMSAALPAARALTSGQNETIGAGRLRLSLV